MQRAVEFAVAVETDASSLWSADTLFGRSVAGDFDGAIATLHDQGQVAVKVFDFEVGVYATIGPWSGRGSTTVTAFDIAGIGLASRGSQMGAILGEPM